MAQVIAHARSQMAPWQRWAYDNIMTPYSAAYHGVIDPVDPLLSVVAGAGILGKVGSSATAGASTAAEAAIADEFANVGFRSNTSHVFRNDTGHLAEDTVANRALIQSALDPANLRTTITLKDGSTLAKYYRALPDGTQAWAFVRNGTEITNGGLNVIPR